MKYLLAFLLVFSFATFAQTNQPIAATEDISGMYTFLRDGEFVQIDADGTRVTGFISRYGDSDSDKGAFLDHMLKEGQLQGNKLHFITKSVHGIWYEFTGTVERGNETDPNKEGFHLLKGKLTQYSEDDHGKASAKSREVTLKSFPADALMNH